MQSGLDINLAPSNSEWFEIIHMKFTWHTTLTKNSLILLAVHKMEKSAINTQESHITIIIMLIMGA